MRKLKNFAFIRVRGQQVEDRAQTVPDLHQPLFGIAAEQFLDGRGIGGITRCGRICWNRHNINVSVVFAGQDVGVRQVSDRIWLVSFMDYDLGYFDDETCRFEPIENPFAARVEPFKHVFLEMVMAREFWS